MNDDVMQRIAELEKLAAERGELMTPYQRALLDHKQNGWQGNAEGSSTPDWINEETLEIDQPLLCQYLVDLYEYRKTAKGFTSWGKRTTKEEIQRAITDEIGKYRPTKAWSTVNAVFRLLPAYIPEEKTEKKFAAFTAADLKGKQLPPPKFVVNSILPCGLCVLAAPPKTGKSWLCLALADAIAAGETFMGFSTDTGKVCYLALEDSEYRIKQRLLKINSTMPENLIIVNRNVSRLDEGLCDQISAFITDNPGAKCVIIDTISRVKTGASMGMNAYESDTQQYAALQELAIQKNVSILCVTHFSKMKQYSNIDDPFERITGSTGLFGVSDAAWLIYGKRGAEEMTFHVTGRDVYDTEFKISFDKEKFRWKMLGNSEQLEEQRKRDEYNTCPLVRTIRELVKESDGRWIGSGETLKAETMKRTQTIPATSSKALFNLLCEIQEQLLKLDGIAFSKGSGGRAGRDYTFETTRQTKIE